MAAGSLVNSRVGAEGLFSLMKKLPIISLSPLPTISALASRCTEFSA